MLTGFMRFTHTHTHTHTHTQEERHTDVSVYIYVCVEAHPESSSGKNNWKKNSIMCKSKE